MKIFIGEQAPIECIHAVIGFIDSTFQEYDADGSDLLYVNPSAIKSLSIKLRDKDKSQGGKLSPQ